MNGRISTAARLVTESIRRRLYWLRLQRYNAGTGNSIQSADVRLDSVKGHHVTVLSGSRVDAFCQLESYSWMGHGCVVTKAGIGRYAAIGNNVSIGPGEHDLERITNTALFETDIYEKLTRESCTIGPDVWIGVDSVIRRGVTVGVGAIVGANSFVNKDVPAFGVVGGNPARLIRYRFNPAQIEAIMKSHWWEMDLEEARPVIRQLESTVAGLK